MASNAERDVLLSLKELKIQKKEERKFRDGLRIFSYEMYHYLMARRFWFKKYPEPIPVTENSEFTEEIGKAVYVVVYETCQKITKCLEYDNPRFTAQIANFENYVIRKVNDVISERYRSMTQKIVIASAILFHTYVHCYIKKLDAWLPYFVEFWPEMFIKLFEKDFDKDNGWRNLREGCLEMAKIYDKQKAELSTTDFRILKLKVNFFQREVDIRIPRNSYGREKLVSRFQTVSETFEKVLPAGYSGGIRGRRETLNIIARSSVKDEFDKLYCSENTLNCPVLTAVIDTAFRFPFRM